MTAADYEKSGTVLKKLQAIEDKKKEAAASKNALETYVYWVKYEGILDTESMEEFIAEEDKERINEALTKCNEWMEDGDGSLDSTVASAFDEQKALVEAAVQPVLDKKKAKEEEALKELEAIRKAKKEEAEKAKAEKKKEEKAEDKAEEKDEKPEKEAEGEKKEEEAAGEEDKEEKKE
eukprot:Hpha_TRINITY_DN16354_c4_g3::TRINITY_DN16354_c4_g3_i1::g.60344::m.60344